MLSSFVTLSSTLVALATLLPYARADCAAYGIDFQNGQSYFINSADNSNFTTVTQFTGCTGVANVILVAPDEDSWLCSDISTTPDGTNQLSTCPILKSQMYSGTWTIITLDNNGDNPSFASQRTFQITVGVQQTTTYTPTVNITSIVTPSITSTVSLVITNATTVRGVTVTAASSTAQRTVTITPPTVTSTVTTTSTRTYTSRKYTWPILYTTRTASCLVPPRPTIKDPWPAQKYLAIAQSVTSAAPAVRARIAAAEPAPAAITPAPGALRRDTPVNVANILGRRAVERLLKKRAPDAPTITITDTTTSDWITTTLTSTTTTTTFFTTILKGITTISVTAPTPTTTRTIQTYTVTTVTQTITKKYAITITKTTTPSSVATACKSAGGILI
ncbi:p-loop containing nucleoside triphosphate hydrolase protein [Rutstroemia sp. NJR-2017a WRK4]|nr:p-loop containing nucleoside triphosphate hydrolase protein [Rutstroemia sp. NJR-2017a WRK4]